MGKTTENIGENNIKNRQNNREKACKQAAIWKIKKKPWKKRVCPTICVKIGLFQAYLL